MEHLKIFFLCILFPTMTYCQDEVENLLVRSRKLGLVSYLTQVKYTSETKMSILINDTDSSGKKLYEESLSNARTFNLTYNSLKVYTDMFINQISADLSKKNYLRLYKCSDKYIKTGKSMPRKFHEYETCLRSIDILSNSLQFKSYSNAAGFSVSDILSAGAFVLNIISADRENRHQKINGITDILGQLHLKEIYELKEKKN